MTLTFALQALLVRHEAYMAEAEEQRRKMDATVDRLEEEKKALEAKNARTIQENRYLLDQLEDLNKSVSDADTQISSLNTTLQSTMKELDRLTALAAQTSHLEKQLEKLELEQQLLHEQIGSKDESEKSAIQRWKNAERTVNALQEQVERIESEARAERARHAEVAERFERRRTVEKELQNAAGRLKVAAAAKGMPTEDESNSVVSSFVKDILQDNANLQLGIVELRDMLMGSNEEVESLREQMLLHQPIHAEVHQSSDADASRTNSLDNELAKTPVTEAVPDFHVHHHYHAAPKTEVKKPLVHRRQMKKRTVTSPGLRTPNSGTQSPLTPLTPTSNPLRPTAMTSAAAILSQTSVTIPPLSRASHTHNWSMSQAPSSAAVSSTPNSPLFDAMSDVPDCSRPTTPGSTYLGSPRFPPRHFKRESDISDYNLVPTQQQQPPAYTISSILNDDFSSPTSQSHPPIPEEVDLEDDALALTPSPEPADPATTDYNPTRLHRASSHESLLSARGLSIPKLRSQPSSQRLLSGTAWPSLAAAPSYSYSASAGIPITSATAATAHRSKAPRGRYDSKMRYSSLLSASQMSTSPPSSSGGVGAGVEKERASLGQRVGALGGWVMGRWGVGAVGTGGREGGDSRVVAVGVDEEGLRECLGDGLLQEGESGESGVKGKDVEVLGGGAAEVVRAVDGAVARKVEGERERGRKRVDRLSTHVEAVRVDGEALGEALGL